MTGPQLLGSAEGTADCYIKNCDLNGVCDFRFDRNIDKECNRETSAVPAGTSDLSCALPTHRSIGGLLITTSLRDVFWEVSAEKLVFIKRPSASRLSIPVPLFHHHLQPLASPAFRADRAKVIE